MKKKLHKDRGDEAGKGPQGPDSKKPWLLRQGLDPQAMEQELGLGIKAKQS